MKKGVLEGEIKAVVFDVGGVLQLGGKPRINPRMVHTSGVHELIANKLKISLDQYFDSIDTAYAKSIEGSISKSILLGIISCNLNYPKEKLEKLFVKTYRKVYHKNNWLFSAAKQMKKQGLKVAVLSDQWHISKEALMQKRDFEIFDEVIVSCDAGMRKPNKELYELLLKKLNAKPHEILFIDNQSWNIIPACNMGMKTILFVNNKKTKEQLKYFGIKVK